MEEALVMKKFIPDEALHVAMIAMIFKILTRILIMENYIYLCRHSLWFCRKCINYINSFSCIMFMSFGEKILQNVYSMISRKKIHFEIII
ncbi:hypothetical protein IEQ34_020020 [Dendrobium chrysotoxum]|uniref:Uncharacterized protein n=1 Tax=Dendrobium chrysotoxum TaxID=161865 RepID=A0AAV7G928_DENCH|nr:hypothetical protein IEQ34_020020 [Dendrobium chrysotoxum]